MVRSTWRTEIGSTLSGGEWPSVLVLFFFGFPFSFWRESVVIFHQSCIVSLVTVWMLPSLWSKQLQNHNQRWAWIRTWHCLMIRFFNFQVQRSTCHPVGGGGSLLGLTTGRQIPFELYHHTERAWDLQLKQVWPCGTDSTGEIERRNPTHLQLLPPWVVWLGCPETYVRFILLEQTWNARTRSTEKSRDCDWTACEPVNERTAVERAFGRKIRTISRRVASPAGRRSMYLAS